MKIFFLKMLWLPFLLIATGFLLDDCKDPSVDTTPDPIDTVSVADDFLSATLNYNKTGNKQMFISRDTNEIELTFNNKEMIIDAYKDDTYYFYFHVRYSKPSDLVAGAKFLISSSNATGTAWCSHKNTTMNSNVFQAINSTDTLYIDAVSDVFDEIKAHFNVKMHNGSGDTVHVTNGVIDFD